MGVRERDGDAVSPTSTPHPIPANSDLPSAAQRSQQRKVQSDNTPQNPLLNKHSQPMAKEALDHLAAQAGIEAGQAFPAGDVWDREERRRRC